MFAKIFAVAVCLFGLANAGALYNSALNYAGRSGYGSYAGYGGYSGYGGYGSYGGYGAGLATSHTSVTKVIPADDTIYSGRVGAGYSGYGYGAGYSGLGERYGSLGYARGYGHLNAGYGGIGSGYYGAPAVSEVSVYRVHEANPSDAYSYGGYNHAGYGKNLAWQ
uniref:Cuticular protein glycine-rich 23 n=1 Tax=Antheraea yamamai TaxID=7121 RepID=G8FVQ0_ANTYA|nr:cuticular protein glycine-rich 23 [Antheraea yamamai]